MTEFKKSFSLLAIFLLFASNLYAANAIDGKTIIFFNHWEEDGESASNSLTPYVGEPIYPYGSPQEMTPTTFGTDIPYSANWYAHTFNSSTASWASSTGYFVDGSANLSERAYKINGPGVGAWAGEDTAYAIVDPVTGDLSVSPQIPRFIRLLNPWPVSAPGISVNGSAPVQMYRDKNRCGWYFYPVTGSTDVSVYFQDINFGDTYGLNGLQDATPFELSSHFGTSRDAFITPRPIPEGAPELTGDYPADSPAGDCFYKLAATIRDFNSNHPNFEFDKRIGDKEANNCAAGSGPAGVTKGMVETTLGSDGKPVSTGPGRCNNSEFDTWFNDYTDPSNKYLSNASTCIDLQMDKAANGQWEIDSRYSEFMGFWPIDSFFVNDEPEYFPGEFYRDTPFIYVRSGENIPGKDYPIGDHNFHFCLETHAEFVYRQGQKFSFTGDDDVWAFINKQLVVDLGGVHAAVDAVVDLDTLGLTEGEIYDFDFFMCERNSTGSNLKIKTSIYFDQKRGLFTEKIGEHNGQSEYTIKKVEESDESCAGQTSTGSSIIDNPNVIFRLSGKNVDDTLSQGVQYGGINITGPNSFWVDNDAITGLGPGSYQLIIQDQDNPTISYVVKITVPGNISIQNTDEVTVLAGTDPVMVIVQNEREGVINQESVPYSLSIGAGVVVFEDEAMTIESDLTALTTGVNGVDTVWVWSDRSQTAPNSKSIRVVDGVGDPKVVNFEIPQLRFIDASGAELTTYDLGEWTFIPNEVRAELFWSGGVCTECAGDTIFFNNTDTLNFKEDAAASSVGHILVDAQGRVTFYVVALEEVSDYSFTITGLSSSTTATYSDITLIEPPFPLIQVAEVRDQDGDGKADQVYIQYNKPIIDSLPESFSYYWPDTTNAFSVAISDFSQYLINDSTLVFDGTVIDSVLTQGVGYVNSPYLFEGNIVPTGRDLADGIGPVIMSATISPQGNSDFINIRFSEPILADSASEEYPWFEFYKFREQKGPLELAYNGKSFSSTNISYLISFDASRLDKEDRAVLGDSIRLGYTAGQTGSLRDTNNNFAADESRFVPILGEPRLEIITYDTLISADNTVEGKGEITIEGLPIGSSLESVIKERNQGGVIVPFEAIQSELDELGIYEVRLDLKNHIFTNLGGYVINQDMLIACDDEIFNGNCRVESNQRDLFITWNYKDKNDRAVGTGVYIVQTLVDIQAAVEGTNDYQSKKTIETYELRGFQRVVK